MYGISKHFSVMTIKIRILLECKSWRSFSPKAILKMNEISIHFAIMSVSSNDSKVKWKLYPNNTEFTFQLISKPLLLKPPSFETQKAHRNISLTFSISFEIIDGHFSHKPKEIRVWPTVNKLLFVVLFGIALCTRIYVNLEIYLLYEHEKLCGWLWQIEIEVLSISKKKSDQCTFWFESK